MSGKIYQSGYLRDLYVCYVSNKSVCQRISHDIRKPELYFRESQRIASTSTSGGIKFDQYDTGCTEKYDDVLIHHSNISKVISS